MTSERDGFSVSIQMAGSSASFRTADVTTTGRSVSAADDVAVESAVAGGDSPDRQAPNRRPRTVQAVREEAFTNVDQRDDRGRGTDELTVTNSDVRVNKWRRISHGSVSLTCTDWLSSKRHTGTFRV